MRTKEQQAKIQAMRAQIKATRVELKKFRDETSTPFSETDIGRGLLRSVQVLCTPFALAHQKVSVALMPPAQKAAFNQMQQQVKAANEKLAESMKKSRKKNKDKTEPVNEPSKEPEPEPSAA